MKLPSLPRLSLSAPWVRPVLYLLAIGLVVFALRSAWGNVKEFFFGDPEVIQARTEAIVQAERAEGISEAAQESMEVVVRVREEHQVVDRITVRNDHDIKQASDAADPAPGVAAALDRALCLRDAYRREPDCLALQGAGGGERAP